MAAWVVGALLAAAGGAQAREVAPGPRFSEIKKMPGHDRPESYELPRPQECAPASARPLPARPRYPL